MPIKISVHTGYTSQRTFAGYLYKLRPLKSLYFGLNSRLSTRAPRDIWRLGDQKVDWSRIVDGHHAEAPLL
jgi:hypothetical protein